MYFRSAFLYFCKSYTGNRLYKMNAIEELKKRIYSGDNVVSLSDMRYLPRWAILLIDIFLIFIAIITACWFFKRFGNIEVFSHRVGVGGFILMVNIFFMYIFKTFAGIIRHSTFIDLLKLILVILCSTISVGFINYGIIQFTGVRLIQHSVVFLFIFSIIACMLLFSLRLVVKEMFYIVKDYGHLTFGKKVLVLGVGEKSVAIAKAIKDNSQSPYVVTGFITNRKDSKSAKLLGKRIYHKTDLEKSTKESLDIDGIIVLKEIISKKELDEWVALFLEKKLQVLKAGDIEKFGSKENKLGIQKLQIEDLLNRKQIKIENKEVEQRHLGKAVLVTGGAGSIGSEIVRQVAQYKPSVLVVLDQAETPLYDIELEMRQNFPEVDIKFILADITHKDRVEALFQEYRFSMVYHAAAYKHVPLVENNPNEGTLANVLGTKNLALLSSEYNVNRFVMVSTDKAVNPTNVMGATKRTAELFVQALQGMEGNKTKFITTRFGNVLGSNGSVIPYFKKQIEAGGPVTITHPDIVRYFMTIPEACELVLTAGVMGNGGEIYVFDMGEPVKIVDLAKRMIKLSGFEPDIDIKIIFTGLRPGEKLYEELLSDDTKNLPTTHEKIMISKDPSMPFADIDSLTDELISLAKENDKMEVVRLIKKIVREFKSNNSIYERLDKHNEFSVF